MANLLEQALRYLAAGLTPLPIEAQTKKPTVAWKEFQTRRPSESELQKWFGNDSGIKAVGTVCGGVSGGLRVYDFDLPGYHEAWVEILGDSISDLPVQRTGGGGVQVLVRCDEPGRNEKLAVDGKEVAIEIRASGGFVVLPPSLHPSGGTYSWFPDSPRKIPHKPKEFIEMLDNAAKSLSKPGEPTEAEIIAGRGALERRGGNQKPRGGVIDAYNAKHSVEDLLLEQGYTRKGRMLCRPGRDGHHSVWIQDGKSYHHSANDPLNNGHLHDAFDIYTHFEHGGNVKAAVKAAGEALGVKREKKAAVEVDEGEAETPVLWFWYPKKVSKDEVTVGILQHKISGYLWENGYTKIYQYGDVSPLFVNVSAQVCALSSPQNMKDFFMDYVRTFPDRMPEIGEQVFSRNAVIEKLERSAGLHFGTPQLECLPTSTPNFIRDTKERAFFYFQNGYTEVTREGTVFHDYADMKGVIWDKQKLHREYHPGDGEKGEFERFLFNVCGQSSFRFDALRTALGYLLHRFKDRAVTRAVVFVDEAISETPEGRSGKSIVSTALCQLRNGLIIDGKKLNFDSPFTFQSVSFDTELVIMDDVKKNFDYESIFHMITSDFTTERKGEHRIIIPFEDAPRFLISTNYILSGEGGSADARKSEYEFSSHYHAGLTPRDEFGHNLFDDWNDTEWARFDTFMMDSVTMFLNDGLVKPEEINIGKRKLLQSTKQDFIDFMDKETENENEVKIIRDEFFEKWISKNDLYEMLCDFSAELRRDRDRRTFTMQKFTQYLHSYATTRGLLLTEKVMRGKENTETGVKGKSERKIRYDYKIEQVKLL